ncbi:cytochrome P450 [Panaeolus papilionaceus]|nr:cytochrome P450 [Panaeolus papilionaceus]
MSLTLSSTESLVAVVASALTTHLIFKRTETHNPIHLVILLVAVPASLVTIYTPHASSLLAAIAAVFALFWTTLASSIVVYRLSPWHPLAKYPGPLLYKITKFCAAFRSTTGRQHIDFQELHHKYGDIVRVGPNELSFRTTDALNPVMGNAGFPKGQFWDGRIPETDSVKPLIALTDKKEHSRRRRPWTRAFSTLALKGYEEIVIKRCLQLVEQLSIQKTQPLDLGTWFSYFSYDVMTDLAFGGGSEMIKEGDKTGLWHLLEGGQRNAIFMSHVPWLGQLAFRFPGFAQDLKAFRNHAKGRALERKKNGSTHKDIFHHLIDEDGISPQPPSIPEVISDGGLAIIAGADTTSGTLANLFYYLMRNPVAFRRLQAEVDEITDGEVFDTAKQAHLPYLNAAINEALRILPPVLTGSQRTPDKGSGGKMAGAYFIPEGTNVFLATYSLHHDPRCFSPLPDTFVPERWLPKETREALEPTIFNCDDDFILDTSAFLPFSMGPANCPGKNLAYMEMRMLVILLMQRFEFALDPRYDPAAWEKEIGDFFVTLKGVLPTLLTPRKGVKILT